MERIIKLEKHNTKLAYDLSRRLIEIGRLRRENRVLKSKVEKFDHFKKLMEA